MKHTVIRLSVLIILIFVAAGCARFVYRTPAQNFKHGVHKEILTKMDYECLDCHKFLKIKGRSFKGALEESEIGLYPRKVICHFCHVDTETRVGSSPYQCATCHDDLYAIRPETHVREWKKFHAVDAKNDRQSCTACHKEWFCSDCHTRRDTVQSVMHPKPYRSFHYVEAQIDPAGCSACHTSSFCTDCHSGKKRRYN